MMKKSGIMLTVLFMISSSSQANSLQLAAFEAPGDAAQQMTPNGVVPSAPPQGTTVIPPSMQNNPGSGSVNCNNPPFDTTPDADVPSISGSAPAQGA